MAAEVVELQSLWYRTNKQLIGDTVSNATLTIVEDKPVAAFIGGSEPKPAAFWCYQTFSNQPLLSSHIKLYDIHTDGSIT